MIGLKTSEAKENNCPVRHQILDYNQICETTHAVNKWLWIKPVYNLTVKVKTCGDVVVGGPLEPVPLTC